METRIIKCLLTKTGRPALWESGGGTANRGNATIITGEHGERLSPAFVRQGGHLSNSDHALFTVRRGFRVVRVTHEHGWAQTEVIVLDQFRDIPGDDQHREATGFVAMSGPGNPYSIHDGEMYHAVETAIAKANTFHCRTAMWLKEAGQ